MDAIVARAEAAAGRAGAGDEIAGKIEAEPVDIGLDQLVSSTLAQ